MASPNSRSRSSSSPDLTLEDICVEHGIVKQQLEKECSDEDLFHMKDWFDEWEGVATYIKLGSITISDIKKESPDSMEDQRLKFLKKWKKRDGPKVTFLLFMESLLEFVGAGAASNAIRMFSKQRSGGEALLYIFGISCAELPIIIMHACSQLGL